MADTYQVIDGSALAPGSQSATVASVGHPQMFEYAFTGTETAYFTVNLPGGGRPAGAPATAYGVQVSFRGVGTNTYTKDVDTKTASGFNLRTGAQVPAGVVAVFLVEDLR